MSKAQIIIACTLTMNAILIMIKGFLFIITSSLAILAYLTDSLIDLINDSVAYYATRKAMKPPDADHPYGHGKYEAFARVFISILLIFTALEIGFESVKSYLFGGYEVKISTQVYIITLILFFVYLGIAFTEYIIYKKTNIKILEASAWHYITDPLTTLLVIGMLIIYEKGIYMVDSIAAILICILIGYGGFRVLKETLFVLTDSVVIDPEIIKRIVLENFYPRVLDCHAIRTRSDGFGVYLECHLLVDPQISIRRAHQLAHEVEELLRKRFVNLRFHSIIIHVEPHEEPHSD